MMCLLSTKNKQYILEMLGGIRLAMWNWNDFYHEIKR